jgi:ribosome-binding protein aMBF1 (putative translation factor)
MTCGVCRPARPAMMRHSDLAIMINSGTISPDLEREAIMPEASAPRPTKERSAVYPVGSTHRAAGSRRARRSAAYRQELERLAPYEGLARIVIARRQALRLTQKQLAERVGTSHSVICRIESGQRPTSVTTLRRLAEAFDTHLVVGFCDEPAAIAGPELIAVS